MNKALLLKIIRNKSNNQMNFSLPKKEVQKILGHKLHNARRLKLIAWEID